MSGAAPGMLTRVSRVPADPERCQRWALTSRLRGWSAGILITAGPKPPDFIRVQG